MKQSSTAIRRPRARAERRREATRAQIARAAERVMADKGVHATKIADIAGAADVGVGTFYLHFKTKQELFDELVADAVARLHATIDAARREHADPLDQVRASTAAVCRFAHENRAVFRIVFGHGGTYHDVVREAQAAFAAELEEVLRAGIAAGRFAPLDAGIAARALVGMTTQVLAWWTAHDDLPIEALETTLTALTLRGLAPVSP